MKLKITALLIIIFLFLGCAFVKDYTEPEKRVIVSCFAIDYKNGFVFTIENSLGDKEGNVITSVYSAQGKTTESAMENLKSVSYGKLLFSQCPVILIGKNVSGEKLKELFYYLFDNNDISLSVKFVCCENAADILNNETKNPKGYEIERLINNNSSLKSISFAEIIDKDLKNQNSFSLPFIRSNNGRFIITKHLTFENFYYLETGKKFEKRF